MDPTGVIVVGSVIAVAAGIAVYRRRKRTESAGKLARDRGWTYADADYELEQRLGQPFSYRVKSSPRHVLTGTHRGRQVLAFQLGSWRVAAVALPVTTRGVLEVIRTQSSNSWPFEDEPDLTELPAATVGLEGRHVAFSVHATRAGLARHLLQPTLVESLAADRRANDLGWPLRFQRGYLYTWCENKVDTEDGTVARLDYLCDVLDQLPARVWNS